MRRAPLPHAPTPRLTLWVPLLLAVAGSVVFLALLALACALLAALGLFL
ncbi:MAG: hypothetical protein INF52_03100 [Rhodobacter sp.]|nr:hypothetical protein [Rhodobacter sp.]